MGAVTGEIYVIIRIMLRKVILASIVFSVLNAVADVKVALDETPGELEGTIVFMRGGVNWIFIQDDNGTPYRVAFEEGIPSLKEGDRIRVAGVFPRGSDGRRFHAASCVRTGRGRMPKPIRMTIPEMFSLPDDGEAGRRDWWGRLLSVEGTVVDVNRRQTVTKILLFDGGKYCDVTIPYPRLKEFDENLDCGAKVRVTGLGVYTQLLNAQGTEIVAVADILIETHGIQDAVSLSKPPFWTYRRILAVAAVSFAVAVFAVAWAFVLKREKKRDKKYEEGIRRERLRLSGDLHDNFQQLLAGCMFRLGAAIGLLPEKGCEETREQLDELCKQLEHTQLGLRSVIWSMTEEAGGPSRLADLIRYAMRRMPHWKERVEIVSDGSSFDAVRKHSGSFLMILQEAVGNAIAHGNASHIKVELADSEGVFSLTVTDNGCGFDENSAHGLGIASMERRAREIGGTFSIAGEPGKGTTLRVEIKHD